MALVCAVLRLKFSAPGLPQGPVGPLESPRFAQRAVNRDFHSDPTRTRFLELPVASQFSTCYSRKLGREGPTCDADVFLDINRGL